MAGSVRGRQIETELGSDGVVRIVVTSSQRIEEDDAVQLLNAIEQVSPAPPIPVLVDIRKIGDISFGTRKVMSSVRAGELISCAAVLVSSALSIMVGRFFLQLSRPPFDMQLFEDEAQALTWAASYLDHAD